MARIPARGPGLVLTAALLAALACPAVPVADDSPSVATLVRSRWGTTPRGATRVVFELDHPANYEKQALPHDGGLEVRLLGVRARPMPSPMPVGSGGVRDVTFRPGPSGIVALIGSDGASLTARSFRLDDPPRIVLDLTRSETGNAPETSEITPDAPAEPVAPDALRNLSAWITDLQRDASALKLSRTEEERARHRRSLAALLAERGLVHEAAEVLKPALESGAGDRRERFADALRLAELRLESGDVEGAATIARDLSAGESTPQQLIRRARVLRRTGHPDLSGASLQEALPRLTGPARAEAQMLLAGIAWERNDVKRAREHVTGLAESAHLPSELKGGALILEADCAWAQGRIRESERLYRRALQERLDEEEASWATLQLGNAARRNGQRAVALDHYRESHERWPDTFYGSQAGWFLRLAERVENAADAAKESGAVEDHG